MISYEVALLPIEAKPSTCAAILVGDESHVQIGKKLMNALGDTLIILSIGTHCEGYQKNKISALVKCSPSKCIPGQYELVD